MTDGAEYLLRQERDRIVARFEAARADLERMRREREAVPHCALCGLARLARSTTLIHDPRRGRRQTVTVNTCVDCAVDARFVDSQDLPDVMAYRVLNYDFDLSHATLIEHIAVRSGFRFFVQTPGAEPSSERFGYVDRMAMRERLATTSHPNLRRLSFADYVRSVFGREHSGPHPIEPLTRTQTYRRHGRKVRVVQVFHNGDWVDEEKLPELIARGPAEPPPPWRRATLEEVARDA